MKEGDIIIEKEDTILELQKASSNLCLRCHYWFNKYDKPIFGCNTGICQMGLIFYEITNKL